MKYPSNKKEHFSLQIYNANNKEMEDSIANIIESNQGMTKNIADLSKSLQDFSQYEAYERAITSPDTIETPGNISSVTAHFITKSNRYVEYILAGTCTLTAGTEYTFETIKEGFRPIKEFKKGLQIGVSALCNGYLTISTTGVVKFKTLTTISAKTIAINEIYQC